MTGEHRPPPPQTTEPRLSREVAAEVRRVLSAAEAAARALLEDAEARARARQDHASEVALESADPARPGPAEKACGASAGEGAGHRPLARMPALPQPNPGDEKSRDRPAPANPSTATRITLVGGSHVDVETPILELVLLLEALLAEGRPILFAVDSTMMRYVNAAHIAHVEAVPRAGEKPFWARSDRARSSPDLSSFSARRGPSPGTSSPQGPGSPGRAQAT